MTSLHLHLPGATLHAAASTATSDDRVREGILVPWDEDGRTHHGPAPVRRGAVTLTADAKIVGVYGHNRPASEQHPAQPAPSVSRVLATEDRPEGLWGRVRIARTPLGDQLLAEIDDGVRDALSVELSDVTFDAAGAVVGARLDFVAHVPVGAYDSARFAAALYPQPTNDGDSVTQPPQPVDAPAPSVPAIDYDALAAAIGRAQPATLHAAAVPGGLDFGALPAAVEPTTHTGAVTELATLQAAVAQEPGNAQLFAALADITNTGLSLFQDNAGAVGKELWSGNPYSRRFVPLLNQQTLTSWKFGGWRWVTKPEIADYAGDKAEIPTGPVSVEPVDGTAQRLAAGWDVDRKFRDFGDAAFWEGFYRAQTESYAEQTDRKAAAAIVAAARVITTNANVPAEYVGTNVAQADVLRAAAYGSAILEDTPNVRRSPDYVLMNSADWLGLMDLTALELPAFLSMLGVQAAQFIRSPLVPAGSVILGVTPALSWFELGGGAPIRVEALDVARAGIDSAVYGYWGTLLNRPGGIIRVPIAAPVEP